MQKDSNIYVTKTNNVANFKIRLPWNWCETIGITEEERGICIRYENDSLVIEKQTEILFSDLSKEEKVLQINKYRSLYRANYDKQKDFIGEVEKYFKVTYRTAYRYLKEELSESHLEDVELIGEQNEHSRNVHLMLRCGRESVTATLTIPSSLAILLLHGKTCEELKIKNIIEIYSENVTLPIQMNIEPEKGRIIIKKKEFYDYHNCLWNKL